ncbi:MAG: ATP-binding protein [Cellvibrionaceae bacterium]|nr:ATP-binding protein [Cellvibrionaceae bacterium]
MSNQLISIIQPGQALMSLRDSGYSFPTAIAEVIDNSLEADANNINVKLFESINGNKKKHVERVAIADDGYGMPIDVLHRYMVIGHSTRWMKKDTIGKYGVGAKLAALNFALKIEAWSRTSSNEAWQYVCFDLQEALDFEQSGKAEQVGVNAPTEQEIPEEYRDLLSGETGTLIVWSKVDRLENGRAAASVNDLIAELTKELGRIFRVFINDGINIKLNNKKIVHHDPLFLMDDSWADQLLTKELKKTAPEQSPKKGNKHFGATVIADRVPIMTVDGKEATLTLTLYPREVTRARGMGGDTLAKKLRVPENQGSLSFMRLGREIAYTNVPRIFGRGVAEADRFIGIEVSFPPVFDEYFGVRNVKRGVEPFNDLRNKIRDELKNYLETARKLLEESWNQIAQQTKAHSGEHSRMEEELAEATKSMPKPPKRDELPPKEQEKEQDQELENLAEDTGSDSSKEEKESYKDSKRGLPFVIENVSYPGKSFIDIRHLSNQTIIRINTRHRFYREMWQPLNEIAEKDAGSVNGTDAVRTARRAVEGLTLMLAAYAKAQSMEQNPHQYDDLTAYWGQFVDTLMSKIKGVV